VRGATTVESTGVVNGDDIENEEHFAGDLVCISTSAN
jgi:hypothetical protein